MAQQRPLLNRLQHLRQLLLTGWQWWLGQLLELCPSALRRLLDRYYRQPLVLVEPTQLSYLNQPDLKPETQLPADGSPEQIRAFSAALPARQVTLLIPDDQVLRIPMQLPAAALPHLATIIEHKLPTLSPFQPDQVYYYPHIIERDSSRISLQLLVVPRTSVTTAHAQLNRLKLKVSQIRPLSLATHTSINLLPDNSNQGSSLRRFNRWLYPVNALLLVALLALPLWQKHQTITSLEKQREALRQQSEEVFQLRQQLEQLEAVSQVLTQLPDRNISLTMLDTLTGKLPDSTWLKQLNWSGNDLILRGEAETASELIAVLDEVADFSDVHFSTPVTVDNNSGKERFSIKLNLSRESGK